MIGKTYLERGVYDRGPSVLVDAETAEEAAAEGEKALRADDGGYGFVCRECDGSTSNELVVVEAHLLVKLTSAGTWVRA